VPPKSSLWSTETWIPARGRPSICRRAYCSGPAVDEVRQLCEDHVGWQPKRTKNDDRRNEVQAKRRGRTELLVDLLAPPSWAAQGACRDHPDIDFFPGQGEDYEPAQAICQSCPVQAECLEAGMDEAHGIWGGTTARERVRLRATKRNSAA
jgi:hypothetical protein